MNFQGFREAGNVPPSIALGLTRPGAYLAVALSVRDENAWIRPGPLLGAANCEPTSPD